MIRFLRDRRAGRGSFARLLLAALAFVGTQAVFLRAAFPHSPRPVATRVIEGGSDAQPQTSVNEARLPARGTRRGGPTVGTSAPIAPESSQLVATRGTPFVVDLEVPPSFVPPPLFRPPRAS